MCYIVGWFLPSYSKCPAHYLSKLLSGKRRYLYLSKWSHVIVFICKWCEDLWNVQVCRAINSQVVGFHKREWRIEILLPHYSSTTLPNKEFLQGIISTLRSDETYNLIKTARQHRVKQDDENYEELVHIKKSIKNSIYAVLAQKCKDKILNKTTL